MYPINPNQYRPRRSGGGTLKVAALLAVTAGLTFPLYAEKISSLNEEVNKDVPEAPRNIPQAAEVTGLDQAAMQAMRDSYPRDEAYLKNINGINYAWPAGRPHRDLFKIALPCNVDAITQKAVQQGGISCHGDPFKDSSYSAGDNYAMDFVYRDAATPNQQDLMYLEPVRAITDGEILSVKQDARYSPNCSSIQFQSIDGYIYYYGHLSDNYLVNEGQRVAAGQQIAEVGEDACGQGVSHLHFDRGMLGHRGGDDDFRDPGTIPILHDLYFSIPD